ncbi:hypothetical protein [Williamsia sp.]|uniref:hypothetical protein n=1 Tax=Williamsia sp. TaxID=1872085 RepID=UPI001A34870B|nr:hypothetical protein [Williamsia sp.]MBJ7289024.1 hypothetical protein [Williamsia sp.]
MGQRLDLPPVARRVDSELSALADGGMDPEVLRELRAVLVNAFTTLENDLFIERGRATRR